MMKKLVSLSLFSIIWCFADGQTYVPALENGKPKISDWPILKTRVYFNIADSTYDYTLYREPGGTFYFAQGFDHAVDDSLSMGTAMFWSPIGGKQKRKDTLEAKTYVPSYHWTANEIHTASRFKSFNSGSGSYINTYDHAYTWIPYIKDLFYTSVQDSLHLQDITKSPVSNLIRLTRFDPDFFELGPTKIEFYEISLDDPTDPKFKYIKAEIDSSRKCNISLDLDFSLNEKDAKAFMETVRSAENEKITYFTKTDLRDPFLIEVRRDDKYTVLERSNWVEPDKEYRSKYCGLWWSAEWSRKRYQKKQAKQ